MEGKGKKTSKRVQGLVKRTVSKSGSAASSDLKLQRKGEKGERKPSSFFKVVKLMCEMYTIRTSFSVSVTTHNNTAATLL